MAEAAPQLNDEEPERTQLRGLEGGGQGGGPPSSRANIGAVPDPKIYDTEGSAPSATPNRRLKSVPSGDDLKKKEEGTEQPGATPTTEHDNAFSGGYKPKGSLDEGSGLSRFKLKGMLGKKRAKFGLIAATGATSITLLLTTVSGPLQFVHFAQTLMKHFNSQSDSQDSRFLKEVRFFRYAAKGEVEKTRLGRFANKFADKYETRMNEGGLKSMYTTYFGNFDGYQVDRSKFVKPDGTPMNDDEIKAAIKDKFGVDVVKGETISKTKPGFKGELIISNKNLSNVEAVKLSYNILRSQGLNKLSASNAARLMIKRNGVTYSPMRNFFRKGQDIAEERITARQEKAQAVNQGSTKEITAQVDEKVAKDATADPSNQDAVKTAANAADAAKGAGQATAEGADLAGKLNAGSGLDAVKASASKLTSSLKENILGVKGIINAGLAYGILCIMKGINDNAPALEQSRVIAPLIRQASWLISAGEKVKAGKIDLVTLGVYSQDLQGIDSNGNKTSWVDAEPIQHSLGHDSTGVKPDHTLTSIGSNDVPFPFLNKFNGVLNVVCNEAVSAFGLVLSFIGGGIGEVVKGMVQGFIQSTVVTEGFALWTTGHAVNPTPVGADLGNAGDFGAVLMANDQALATGGIALSSKQVATLQNLSNMNSSEDFNSHSIAYKIFDVNDQRTAISKLIDGSSQSFGGNLAKMGSALLNVGHLFGSLGSIFGTKAHAASTPYDYGFPIYGFSADDLYSSDETFQNPYENSCYVVGCTDPDGKVITGILGIDSTTNKPSADGQKYIDKAKDCFNVNITADSNGDWGVSSISDTDGSYQPYNKASSANAADCASPSGLDATGWKHLRFFILDTTTAEAMSCYGGDPTACTNIGYNSTSSGSATTSPTSGSCSGSDQYSAIVSSGASFAGTDQGIDFVPKDPTVGFDICAPASGTITLADQTGHKFDRTSGQAEIILQMDNPPTEANSSKFIYFAEIITINDSIKVGTHVNKGDLIGHNNASPGIETGWGVDATHGFPCAVALNTVCGQSFNSWILAGGGQ